jgi:hypothetical protein
MYWQPAPINATAIPVSRLSLVAMWIVVGLIFILGIFPQVAVGRTNQYLLGGARLATVGV